METTAREVITEDYRRQQQELHKNPNYGVASLMFAPVIAKAIRQLGVTSVSDYGAGKQNLLRGLTEQGIQIDYRPYDPAFPEYGPARSADMVCCIDVLEHIEPDCLDAVLDELRDLTARYGVFTVHTGPAKKVLSDGRNAHLIQKPSSWWLPKLCERFEVEGLHKVPNGFLVVVAPRKPS
ncbi:class I SAM-dependent methyltransferase [Phenylobacterium sp. J367]|uniref:class I SAM-dependent methyltransferase n=1 Tax=Phenylobacterium sp. J367 TaxID=2898435 RepID=UPI0021515895|nr:class I SAM-dependent methyltransferase [Phenylobacterium sp. J367]MCR5877770.1 class I SAM-dependent methyltransferase [Phenylobacterium sp. J367]